jgi:hypothetical protein
MTRLVWDEEGKRRYETGVSHAVLYVKATSGSNAGRYTKGVAWNGLTGVTESPSGAEETALYANNGKYLSLYSAEDFGGTIKAYTYPDQWELCDGNYAPTQTNYSFDGVRIAQQPRAGFGLCYRTQIGNDTMGDDYGFKLHIIWNAMATPSSKDYQTINDSPEAIEFSWDYTTVPTSFTNAAFSNIKPTSVITIDSRKADQTKLNNLMNTMYGTTGVDPQLPTPDDVLIAMRISQ